MLEASGKAGWFFRASQPYVYKYSVFKKRMGEGGQQASSQEYSMIILFPAAMHWKGFSPDPC
ncbi:MAG: hypothetical protein QXI42_02135 [Thermoproteota archaeon]|nr:hypothetical protein [Candidatus Brockarchaeota archaeon]